MDRASKEWDLVIKVKYGNALRRFGAHVQGSSIDQNMDQLRARIINLFRFTPDADVILTYTDVDGDLVTLANDDELLDAVIYQHLNPLRINVQFNGTPSNTMNTEPKLGNSLEYLEQTRTNFSPQPPSIDRAIAEAFKYVPEPLVGSLSKLSQDLAFKASASAPAISSIVDHFTKLGLSCAFSAGAINQEGNLDVHGGAFPGDHFLRFGNSNPLAQTSKPVEQQPETGKSREDLPRESRAAALPVSLINQGQRLETNDNLSSSHTSGSAVLIPNMNNKDPLGISLVPASTCKSENDIGSIRQTGDSGSLYGPVDPSRHVGVPYRRPYSHHNSSQRVFHRGVQCDGCGMLPITGSRYKSTMKDDYDLCRICFLEMGNEYDYIRMDEPQYYTRSSCHFQNSMLHSLRGHGMGPSKVKLDSRFILDVTILDGTLMPPSTPFIKIWKMQNNGNTQWPSGTHLIWIGGDKLSETNAVELEITANGFPAGGEMDIAVDFVSPSRIGRHMSYWRLCSPSGQKFGQRVWVLIQVDVTPSSGFFGGVDLNISPPCSGRNGAGIIDINVEPVEDLCHSEPHLLTSSVQVVDIKQPNKEDPLENIQYVPVVDAPGMADSGFTHDVPQMFSVTCHPVAPSPSNITRGKAHAVSYSFLDLSVSPPLPPFVPYPAVDSPSFIGTSAESTISYPPIGSSLNLSTSPTKITTPLVSSVQLTASVPMICNDLSLPVAPDDNTTEQALLKELHEMGFKQVDLNKEILRMNEYDLEQSLNDLCGSGVGDWDPHLVELQEMGFMDMEKNKKLLIKNGGSIKRVVLELIAGEKVCIDHPSNSEK